LAGSGFGCVKISPSGKSAKTSFIIEILSSMSDSLHFNLAKQSPSSKVWLVNVSLSYIRYGCSFLMSDFKPEARAV
jgi:hypothetical protein